MASRARLLVSLSCLLGAVVALLPDGRPHGNFMPRAAPPMPPTPVGPVVDVNGTTIPPLTTIYTFDQLIDHSDPSKGTFKQRYFHTWQYYVAGGPLVLMTPGETAMDGFAGYLGNGTMSGLFAQQNGGAGVVIEHRFFGFSNPTPDLSTASLSLHTIEQAVDDLVYFTQNVKLPMPGGTPSLAPWILVGGSYSGALTGWTMNARPGAFWAGYASSAVVETQNYFWGYFEPIRQNMAKNCSADVEAVINHIDETIAFGTPAQIHALKSNWGLQDLSHLEDFIGSLRNNLWDWQGLGPTSPRSAIFFQFCDALEFDNGVAAPASGFGLQHALKAWGTFWNTTYYNLLCGDDGAEDCLGSFDPTQSFWTNTTIPNSNRSWTWFVCNFVGYYTSGAPLGWPSLVSRFVLPPNDFRTCSFWFPEKFQGPAKPANTAETNAVYRGWGTNATRLFFANGKSDPWREVTMSTDFIHARSTANQPIAESDGFHCTDLLTGNGAVDKTVKQVQDLASSFMATWIAEWHAQNPTAPAGIRPAVAAPSALPSPTLAPLSIPTGIVNATAPAATALPDASPSSPSGGSRGKFAINNPLLRRPL